MTVSPFKLRPERSADFTRRSCKSNGSRIGVCFQMGLTGSFDRALPLMIRAPWVVSP
jgi:hypothetical protein